MKKIVKNTVIIYIVLLFNMMNIFGQEVTFITHIVDDNFDGPGGIYIADLNNDGQKDIISAAIDDNTIAWWENQKGDSITWQKYIIDSDFIGAIYVSTADVDGDSLPDILGAAYYCDEIAWWHNEGGNPILWTKQTIESNFIDAHEIMAYDIDQDNDMDILGVSAGLNTIAWFENDGSYPVQWTKHIVENNFAGARSVDAGDLDGDGDIDLAGAALLNNEIAWWRNEGNSPIEWTKFTINSNFMYSHKVHISDIDKDNDLDILGTAYSSGVSWWRNDGGDTIVWEKQIVGVLNTAVIAWAVDMNQDNDMDIICSAQDLSRLVMWNNEGSNSLNWDYQLIDNTLSGSWPLYCGDLDNDSDIDIVCGGNYENEIRWYENDLITTSNYEITENPDNLNLICFPVPFKEEINIKYTLPDQSFVTIQIFDFTGRLIKDLLMKEQLQGDYCVTWNKTNNMGSNIQPGNYFCILRTETDIIVSKIILVK